MFGTAMTSHSNNTAEIKTPRKRQHGRRSDDRCVTIINGQMHPVENWSSGGMMVAGDERLFAIGQECIFTLKFKLRGQIIEIDHKASVVRKAPNKIALQFLPLTKTVKANFHKVVDDYVAQRFAESQS
ncbi:MAG: PilZ domain-containing protein [Alphaproteobacteria bacterium]